MNQINMFRLVRERSIDKNVQSTNIEEIVDNQNKNKINISNNKQTAIMKEYFILTFLYIMLFLLVVSLILYLFMLSQNNQNAPKVLDAFKYIISVIISYAMGYNKSR